MRGLSLTRRVGEHVVLLKINNQGEEVVTAIITLIEIDGSRVRYQIQADQDLKIRRFEGPIQ
jgi:sRNA-binding carbon storage regulator CsrA